ncbi:MAG: amidohydrolase family protein [Verrucomicrobia bacterium]|nr:amidohydrolase family protein [Verrucomicrobiota bacterium]MDA1066652.1 amidohydrolase family protein [Verrucomicrobiota bacterium]
MNRITFLRIFSIGALLGNSVLSAELAVKAETIYTMDGEAISNGVILIDEGKFLEVGSAADVNIPNGWPTIEAVVVTPGLIDAHTTVGLSGMLNQAHDQEQVEKSSPIQPELRAIDAYNGRDELVDWIRNLGVTTVHTGHGPGSLISGQTMILKTVQQNISGNVIKPFAMITGSLGEDGINRDEKKSPGTRAKTIALLRAELIKTGEYLKKLDSAEEGKEPARDLRLEALGEVLQGNIPLLITAHRHQDIGAALRLAREFGFRLILDGASEAHLIIDDIKEAGVPVIVHPTMMRAGGDSENMTMEMAAILDREGIPFALQSGFESYVPKTRVVLFEAAMASSYGLPFEAALSSITISAAEILEIDDRVGSISVGKDADLALFDGDPFEYTTHCTGVVINGIIVKNTPQ